MQVDGDEPSRRKVGRADQLISSSVSGPVTSASSRVAGNPYPGVPQTAGGSDPMPGSLVRRPSSWSSWPSWSSWSFLVLLLVLLAVLALLASDSHLLEAGPGRRLH
jgi:hypothetical protein